MLIVRHGQSEWNALGRWQGRADPPLSDLGRRQASQAADLLGSFDAIVASPLTRALHTAEIIADALGVGPVTVEPDLVERDVGEWSGLTTAEIDRDWPGYRRGNRRPPGFESDSALLDRTLDVFGRLSRRFSGAEILVVCHGGLIYSLEAHHDMPFERIPNLGARWMTHDADRSVMGDRVFLGT